MTILDRLLETFGLVLSGVYNSSNNTRYCCDYYTSCLLRSSQVHFRATVNKHPLGLGLPKKKGKEWSMPHEIWSADEVNNIQVRPFLSFFASRGVTWSCTSRNYYHILLLVYYCCISSTRVVLACVLPAGMFL